MIPAIGARRSRATLARTDKHFGTVEASHTIPSTRTTDTI